MKPLNDLIKIAKEIYQVDPTSKTRERPTVYARNAIYAVARDCYGLTYEGIGKVMMKDHATVLYGYKQHEILMKYDKEYNSLYNVFYQLTHNLPADKIKMQILRRLRKLNKEELYEVLNFVKKIKE